MTNIHANFIEHCSHQNNEFEIAAEICILNQDG